ncbi:MAG: GNAT family N-acetyltransferase [Anaerolineaceae bacterium]|nr:GNAT family N-acetyltransferase [Anaerolineaceae bacterium]
MMNLNTFVILEYDYSRWMEFISSHPGSCLFHHPAWVGMVAHSYGYHPFLAAVINPQEKIIAGVPIIETLTLTRKRRWVSLPFTDHCQPLHLDEEGLQQLATGILEESRRQKIADLELRWKYLNLGIYHSSEFVVTTIELNEDKAKIAARIKSNHRRKLHVAARRGVEVERGTSLKHMKAFYQLQVETRQRLGVPSQPWRFFQHLQKEVLEPGLGFISLAHREGKYLAGVVYLHWNQTLIYKYSSSSEEARTLYASDLLVWDGIEWGCENGFLILDLGRSSMENEGLRRYKKRWAAEEKPLCYSRNYKYHPSGFKYKLTPIMKSVINYSPKWVCRLSGQLFYRYFG